MAADVFMANRAIVKEFDKTNIAKNSTHELSVSMATSHVKVATQKKYPSPMIFH
jgi:hypothetical protein